jgi:glyoxylase-like metal-dependent hydrolase (beta-lactamase superfamily II)
MMAAALLATSFPARAQAPAGQGDGARQGGGAGAPGAPGGRQGGGPGGGGGGRQGGGAPAAPPVIKQVKPGLYIVTGLGGNTTVRVDPAGLIVVDTKNLGQANYDALMQQIKTVSQAPVKYVFITHHHQDHSGNIGPFQAAGAEVIVQENLNKNLETYAPAQGKPEKAKVTYTKDRKVKLGKAKAEAHYYGRGHTNGDSFVYFPDLKVVSTGDMVVGAAPNSDMPFGGSVVEWVASLDKLLKLDFDTVVPGHSAPAPAPETLTRAQVVEFRNKMNTLMTRARDLVKAGTPKEELLAKIKTVDIGWNVNNQQWGAANRLDPFYAELQAAAAKTK